MITTKAEKDSHNRPILGSQLNGVKRCPHCGVVEPHLVREWSSNANTQRSDGKPGSYWAAFRCETCGSIVAVAAHHNGGAFFVVDAMFPQPKVAHDDVPEIARKFLQQAFETLHAPDASAVMAGSAVDAMLKEKGLEKGSLYERIDQALEANILTEGMAKWAHSVRLGSNRPRHADKETPHVSAEEAEQSVEFAEALGQFLFVLTARINRGIEAARQAG